MYICVTCCNFVLSLKLITMSSVQKQIIKNIFSDYNLFFSLKCAHRDKQAFYKNLLLTSKPKPLYATNIITKEGQIIPVSSGRN